MGGWENGRMGEEGKERGKKVMVKRHRVTWMKGGTKIQIEGERTAGVFNGRV